MIDTILFDFDGTLVDTNNAIIQSWQHTFRTLRGREEDEAVLVPTFGETLDFTMKKFFPDVPTDEAIAIYRGFQYDHFLDMIEIYPGMKDTLQQLKASGCKIGIVTSRLMRTTMEALGKFGIDEMFDVIITPEDTDKHKPDPEPALVALEKLGSVPENAAMAGDTLFDLGCAKNAGVTSVLVGWSFARQYDEELQKAVPDIVIDKAEDLLKLI